MKRKLAVALVVLLVVSVVLAVMSCSDSSEPVDGTPIPSSIALGVWNNADFSKPASEWVDAAKSFGGEDAVIDLVVAQAHSNGLIYLPFPFEDEGFLYSTTSTDYVEDYLSRFDSDGVKVILSIQPLDADIKNLIGIVLSRYSNYENILGINIDIEWKESGTPFHVSNEERDLWLSEIKKYNSDYKLFITYFGDYTYFPDDHPDLVILFDGEEDTQTNLLKQYQDLAQYYDSVGLYTGYSSSIPPVASIEQISTAVPNTNYIIHTYDLFDERKIVIFQMNGVQVDWLESLSIDLIELHIEKMMPVLCAVIPNKLDNAYVGGGYLPTFLESVNEDYSDLVEVGENGYTYSDSERLEGLSYDEQKEIIEAGLQILTSMGITPSTFIPPYGSMDNTTVMVLEDLGFKFLTNYTYEINTGLSSDIISILDNYVWLTTSEERNVVIKTAEQIMEEIDQNEKAGPVIISYQFYDFWENSDYMLLQLSDVLEALNSSGKYLFLTPRQYQEMALDQ